jgi:4-hydroxybenzoate polyprenyltransferase
MVDRADDLKIGIKTSAITFGHYDIAAIMLCYGITLALLALVGWQLQLAWPYYLSLMIAAGIAVYHYSLIKQREPAQCFKAFLHNNWFGAVVFAGMVVSLLPIFKG